MTTPKVRDVLVELVGSRYVCRVTDATVRAVAKRTVLAVAQAIVDRQSAFVASGKPEDLRPLVLREVASDIGVHECTVSRMVRGRRLHTPHGRYPLSRFFESRLDSDDGQGVSSTAVKVRIAELITAEDASRPLADEALVDLLRRDGIRVSRRAVANYRLGMGLPSSHERRAVRA